MRPERLIRAATLCAMLAAYPAWARKASPVPPAPVKASLIVTETASGFAIIAAEAHKTLRPIPTGNVRLGRSVIFDARLRTTMRRHRSAHP